MPMWLLRGGGWHSWTTVSGWLWFLRPPLGAPLGSTKSWVSAGFIFVCLRVGRKITARFWKQKWNVTLKVKVIFFVSGLLFSSCGLQSHASSLGQLKWFIQNKGVKEEIITIQSVSKEGQQVHTDRFQGIIIIVWLSFLYADTNF